MPALSALIFSLFDYNPEPELTRHSSIVNPAEGTASVTAVYQGELFKIDIHRVKEKA